MKRAVMRVRAYMERFMLSRPAPHRGATIDRPPGYN